MTVNTYVMWYRWPDGAVYNSYRRVWQAYDAGRHEEFVMEAPVKEPVIEAPAEPAEKPLEEKSALDDAKDQAEDRPDTGGAPPPKEGHCRECKRVRRLNRLKLCYPCFVELVLMDEAKKRGHAWKSGDKHPDFCACEGLGEHPERDKGAWRGN